MVSEERQRIMETNRSLRNIKNELEALLEKGVIDESAFDSIHRLLPAESSLSGGAPAPSRNAAPPPSYAQTTGSSQSTQSSGPPALPLRNNPPPPQPASKPVLAHARALYKYAATDARDCSLEKDDRVAVHEYMNADWWMGKNLRTGQEGIFPKSYVEVESPTNANGYVDEKRAYAQPGADQPAAASSSSLYPAPPKQSNPYNNAVPPMAVADGGGSAPGGSGKGSEYGKKFGKKLGNAAVFGAGATLGGKIVNSIF